MFIIILEVLMDQTETKSIKLKFYLDFININNLSDFQKSERPITRTPRKLNHTLLQLENKTNKNIFSEYRDTRFWVKSNKPHRQEKRHNHHHEKPLKVNPCSLGARQFCGAGNSSKTCTKVIQHSSPTPPT